MDYTEEDVALVAQTLFEAGVSDATPHDDARTVLDALAAAGRLLPADATSIIADQFAEFMHQESPRDRPYDFAEGLLRRFSEAGPGVPAGPEEASDLDQFLAERLTDPEFGRAWKASQVEAPPAGVPVEPEVIGAGPDAERCAGCGDPIPVGTSPYPADLTGTGRLCKPCARLTTAGRLLPADARQAAAEIRDEVGRFRGEHKVGCECPACCWDRGAEAALRAVGLWVPVEPAAPACDHPHGTGPWCGVCGEHVATQLPAKSPPEPAADAERAVRARAVERRTVPPNIDAPVAEDEPLRFCGCGEEPHPPAGLSQKGDDR